MKAAQLSQFGGPEHLCIVDVPDPHPGPDQVRLAVRAAGFNATEIKMRQGVLSFCGTLPQTTERDVAGIVDEVGAHVTDVAVGDCVFGVSDEGAGAATLTLATHRARIPGGLGFVDAAALPCALETATRALGALSVPQGEILLVNGAAGGIGSTVVQLACACGIKVIGTASVANHTYLKTLGATPVRYGSTMVQEVRAVAPKGVARTLDVAGTGVLLDLIALAGGAQRVVTLADMKGAKQHGVSLSSGFGAMRFMPCTPSER